jgi:ATP phosphoribosyltransferase
LNTRLKIAIQKSGRLSEQSLELLENCGIQFARSKDKLFWYGRNLPVDLLLIRDDDIPRLLLDGVCDLGICGENVARECLLDKNKPEADLRPEAELGFGFCRLCLAVPETVNFATIASLDGRRIATSYPALTQAYLQRHAVSADIVELSGAVEIAPSMGTADAIVDLVSTGTTLRANQLKEVAMVMESQAMLYSGTRALDTEARKLRDLLVKRILGILQARDSKYVMMHAPKSAVDAIADILPGAESPTILSLEGQSDRVAVHTLCTETVFWEHLEELKTMGATAILVLPVEKMLT